MKVHLRNGEINTELAKCGNNNRKYAYGLICVDPKEFIRTPNHARCSHCCDIFMKIRNKQRKAAGKPLVKTWNEGFKNCG